MKRLSVYLRTAVLAATAAAMAAVLFAGCSSGGDAAESTAADTGNAAAEGEETAAEDASTAESDDGLSAAYQQDIVTIALLDPVKPDDLGTVSKLVYKGLTVNCQTAEEITEESVDEYLSTYILPYMPVEIEDGTVQEGDIVSIDYVGTMDGVAFDGGTGSYDLEIGSESFIPGFEDGLIGAKTGESVSLDLAFPEDYWSEELAGKAVNFAVDINSIKRVLELEEYNDAAARALMDDDTATVESSRQYILEYLDKMAEVTFKSNLYTSAIAAALEASEVEPSEEAKEWDLDVTIKSYDANLQIQGYSLAYYLYYGLGIGYDEFREQLRAEVDESASEAVLKYAICEAEGLEYNDETRAMYLEEFGYTSDELDEAAKEFQQEQAVIWYLAGKAVVDNGTVIYTEAEEPAAEDDEADGAAESVEEEGADGAEAAGEEEIGAAEKTESGAAGAAEEAAAGETEAEADKDSGEE